MTIFDEQLQIFKIRETLVTRALRDYMKLDKTNVTITQVHSEYSQRERGVFRLKYLKQFSIILFISLLGEILHSIVPLPMPASIYGLAILFTALSTGIIPLEEVRETGRFLIEVMPLMFIPAAVGLLGAYHTLMPVLVPYVVITLVSTLLVMLVAGRVTQAMKGEEQTNE